MINIIQKRKIWFAFSLILAAAGVAALLTWGLRFGIDFTGGTLMEFGFKNKVLSSQEIKYALKDLNLGEVNVQFSGKENVLLRFKDIDEDAHQKIIEALESAVSSKNGEAESDKAKSEEKNENINSSDPEGISEENIEAANDKENKALKVEVDPEIKPEIGAESKNNMEAEGISSSGSAASESTSGENNNITENNIEVKTEGGETINAEPITHPAEENIEEKRFDSIGPVIGNELKGNAFWAIVIALAAIVLYVGWAFRKVSRPISSFKYGIIATIALFHDVVITLGVFSVLGHFYNVEIGVPFVAAILAVLGYSVNDTIVVFDRTRENLLRSGIDDFEKVVNKSVNETLVRSLNTSFTTLLVLFALYLFGGETIKYFVVALMVGIFFGTYSSIFIASPLLVTWQRWNLRKNF